METTLEVLTTRKPGREVHRHRLDEVKRADCFGRSPTRCEVAERKQMLEEESVCADDRFESR